jgi:hypothetical protein
VTREAKFRIISRWSPRTKDGEKDVADISLHVGRNVLTQLPDTDTHQMRDHFRASAVSLAIWFADNWWRLYEAHRLSEHLGSSQSFWPRSSAAQSRRRKGRSDTRSSEV